MILSLVNSLLYIEPEKPAALNPLIDNLTKIMTAALRKYEQAGGFLGEFVPGVAYKGSHVCSCGKASSSNQDFKLFNGLVTNSLCIHYLAYHRDEISEEELKKVMTLDTGHYEEPTENELAGHIWLDKLYKAKSRKNL